MVDKRLSNSSFLALRFKEMLDVDLISKLKYRQPEMPLGENSIFVKAAKDIDNTFKVKLALSRQIS